LFLCDEELIENHRLAGDLNFSVTVETGILFIRVEAKMGKVIERRFNNIKTMQGGPFGFMIGHYL